MVDVCAGRAVSVNVSEEKGTIKLPVAEIVLNEFGISGDGHSGTWHRQVSLLSSENMVEFSEQAGREVSAGEFAENITVEGIDFSEVALLDRFVAGEAELEVTQIGKTCHGSNCAIFQEVGACLMPKQGLFARVLRGGAVRAGDKVEHIQRPLRIRLVTLSDTVSSGEATDRSGPKIRACLQEFFAGKRWHPDIRSTVLPDDVQFLRQELVKHRDAGVDFIFTTGGTGISPRDITVDVVTEMADKLVPAVMDQIRLKYAEANPNVLLSRSVMAVLGGTIVYTLPGSVRAVAEYMAEIVKTLEHALKMINRLGH